MKRRLRERAGLSLLFASITCIIFIITTFIVQLFTFFVVYSGLHLRLEALSDEHGLFLFVFIVLLACIVVGAVVSFVVGGVPLKPIRQIISATNRLAAGDFSVRLDIERPSEMKALSDSFNRMAQELGGIELLRTDFINNFSHEFKTPIVSIKGFAELLRCADLTDEERAEYLDIIIRESSRLAALATNVLNLSKVENQEIVSDRTAFNLGEQLRRSVLMLQNRWEEKGLALTVEVEELSCTGSPELLSQVWLNLLDNAVKFTPAGGTIAVSLAAEGGMAVCRIADNGPAIAPDQLPHIFDKFYQGDLSHAAPGNGLGLAVAKRIVELHRGTIGCTSTPASTEFTVRLPLEDPA